MEPYDVIVNQPVVIDNVSKQFTWRIWDTGHGPQPLPSFKVYSRIISVKVIKNHIS